jgi:hypothetical protein
MPPVAFCVSTALARIAQARMMLSTDDTDNLKAGAGPAFLVVESNPNAGSIHMYDYGTPGSPDSDDTQEA